MERTKEDKLKYGIFPRLIMFGEENREFKMKVRNYKKCLQLST